MRSGNFKRLLLITSGVCSVTPALIAAGVWFVKPGNTRADDHRSPYCEVWLDGMNRNRHVYGTVTAECTYDCPRLGHFAHSHPFGNWGVDSNIGGRQDSRQYMGWQFTNAYCSGESMNDPEWNSCTTDESLRGNSEYYNHNNNLEQFKADEERYGSQVRYIPALEPYDDDGDGWIEGGGCRDFDGMVHTLRNNFMDLYELDRFATDAYVGGVGFNDLSVTLSCPVYNQCVVSYSPWTLTWPNPVTQAEVAVRAYGSLVYR